MQKKKKKTQSRIIASWQMMQRWKLHMQISNAQDEREVPTGDHSCATQVGQLKVLQGCRMAVFEE